MKGYICHLIFGCQRVTAILSNQHPYSICPSKIGSIVQWHKSSLSCIAQRKASCYTLYLIPYLYLIIPRVAAHMRTQRL